MKSHRAHTETVYWDVLEHGEWTLHLAATEHGLCCITLPNESYATLSQWIDRHIPGAKLHCSPTKLAVYAKQLQEYLVGKRQAFTCPLDLRGTAFQTAVWRALLDIPFGSVESYTEVAIRVGRPSAVRAVGAANGANPVPIIVPCHRVIGKSGTLVGYRGGVDVKAELLRLEGVHHVPQI